MAFRLEFPNRVKTSEDVKFSMGYDKMTQLLNEMREGLEFID